MIDPLDGQHRTIDEWIDIASKLEFSNKSELIPLLFRSFELLKAIESHSDKSNSLRELRRQHELSIARDDQRCSDVHRLIYGFIGSLTQICDKITPSESKNHCVPISNHEQHQKVAQDPREVGYSTQQTMTTVKEEEDLSEYNEVSVSPTPSSSINWNNRQVDDLPYPSPFFNIPKRVRKDNSTVERYPHLPSLSTPHSALSETRSVRRSDTVPFTLETIKALSTSGGDYSHVKSEEPEKDEEMFAAIDNQGIKLRCDESESGRNQNYEIREEEEFDEDAIDFFEGEDEPSSSRNQNIQKTKDNSANRHKSKYDEIERSSIMKCSVCQEVFSSAPILLSHLKTHHGYSNLRKLNQWLECRDCGCVLFSVIRHMCSLTNMVICKYKHGKFDEKSFKDLIRRKSVRMNRYPKGKPDHSYRSLAGMAIMNSPTGLLSTPEIYKYITERFPYYEDTPCASWKSCIRHVLAYSDCFYKRHSMDSYYRHVWGIVHDSKIDFTEKKSC